MKKIKNVAVIGAGAMGAQIGALAAEAGFNVKIRDIEERFKPKLERWNGTLKAVAGVHKMLQIYMAATYKPGAWQEEEEIAEEEWVQILDKET